MGRNNSMQKPSIVARLKSDQAVAVGFISPALVVLSCVIAIPILRGIWDDYMMSLIIMQDASMKTLPVGIAETFLGEYCYNYGGMMAFAVIGSLPIVLLFIFLQKHMIAGLTAGAVKG